MKKLTLQGNFAEIWIYPLPLKKEEHVCLGLIGCTISLYSSRMSNLRLKHKFCAVTSDNNYCRRQKFGWLVTLSACQQDLCSNNRAYKNFLTIMFLIFNFLLFFPAILQRATVDVGQIRIQGVATCLFLCMDACGNVYGAVSFSSSKLFI